ncbi:MAG: class I SAM-dependent methyltransferase [Dissulfurimicrobium sp.]|uniref:class I SAM-dependent methyltransferase n=1 Tax=Dissulfurimicrobium sp. TaxID=2022436 RepID=UPI003D0D24C6
MNVFDKIASNWDEEPARVALAHGVASAIAENVPLNNSMKALEYGCGTGLVTLEIARRVREVLAADASEGMLSVLKEKIARFGVKNIFPLFTDLTKTGPLDGGFDLIYTSMTLHHILDFAGMLKTFRCMLMPGGFMAIADLDLEDGSFHRNGAPIPAHNGFDRSEILTIMGSLGLKDLKAVTAHEMRRAAPDGSVRVYPVFLIVGVLA